MHSWYTVEVRVEDDGWYLQWPHSVLLLKKSFITSWKQTPCRHRSWLLVALVVGSSSLGRRILKVGSCTVRQECTRHALWLDIFSTWYRVVRQTTSHAFYSLIGIHGVRYMPMSDVLLLTSTPLQPLYNYNYPSLLFFENASCKMTYSNSVH